MKRDIFLHPMSVLKGRWYNKEFRVIEPLGTGGTASIYLVREIPTDREYALKVSRDMTGINSEYRALSRLAHLPYIPRAYYRDDCIIEGEINYFFCMSYFNGKNLKNLFAEDKMSPKTVLRITAVICRIIKLISRYNLYYCDIKPENIMFDGKTGNICIVDFGGIVEKGDAIMQFTPGFDRAGWGMGNRTADEGYQVFAVLMMLLGLLLGDIESCGKDFDRLKARVNNSQLSKCLKKVIIEGLEQGSPSLEGLAADLAGAARKYCGEKRYARQRIDILIDIGLMLAVAVFVAVLIVVI
jgi:serine/threonine-protein kinase